MSDKKRYTLHYGGETFDLGDSDRGLLDEYDGTPGVIRLNLDSKGWLTLALGPGIPIAIEEKPVRPARMIG